MVQKCEAPLNGGALRNGCGGPFRDLTNPVALQAQFLITTHNIRPELAVMLAAAIFGGCGHG